MLTCTFSLCSISTSCLGSGCGALAIATSSNPSERLGVACQGVYYVPDFISSDEEAELLRHVDAASAGRWFVCGDGRRRTQNWGGHPGRREVTEVRQAVLILTEYV